VDDRHEGPPIAGHIGHQVRSDHPNEAERDSNEDERGPRGEEEDATAITADELAMLFESERTDGERGS
jgi:hypothetical protein